MKRIEAQPIGAFLDGYIKSEGLEIGLIRIRVFNAWNEAVGDDVARATSYKFYRDRVLTCTISSSMLRNQLYFQRTNICFKINALLGENLVDKLILK